MMVDITFGKNTSRTDNTFTLQHELEWTSAAVLCFQWHIADLAVNKTWLAQILL